MLIVRKKNVQRFNADLLVTTYTFVLFTSVICVSRPLGAGDTGDIAGLNCQDLTADESRQCRRCAGVLISR